MNLLDDRETLLKQQLRDLQRHYLLAAEPICAELAQIANFQPLPEVFAKSHAAARAEPAERRELMDEQIEELAVSVGIAQGIADSRVESGKMLRAFARAMIRADRKRT